MKILKEDEVYILNYAVKTRLVFLSLIILSNWLIPEHKPSDVFETPLALNCSSSLMDKVVLSCLSGVTHWDAQHFYHISYYGYTYENNLAFFPLFPAVLSLNSRLVTAIFSPYITFYPAVIISSILVNFTLFVLTSFVLYRLSLGVFFNRALAKKAALFFCISPASVFFIAGYSETLYSLLAFSGMLQVINGRLIFSSFFFALAAACRSNGIVNLGFLVHYCILCLCNIYSLKSSIKDDFVKYLSVLVKLGFSGLLIICPYLFFQVYSYFLFCIQPSPSLTEEIIQYSVSKKLVLPRQDSVWCNYTLPLAYPYVQDKYWDVGFLKYFVFKQIPNFVLAFPIIFTFTIYTIVCMKYYMPVSNLVRTIYLKNNKFKKDCHSSREPELMPKDEFAFVMHGFALTVFCTFFINVQVTTRLLCSSSPILYWVIARFFLCNEKSTASGVCANIFPFNAKTNFIVGRLLKNYFLIYSVLGVILFSNNYPWT